MYPHTSTHLRHIVHVENIQELKGWLCPANKGFVDRVTMLDSFVNAMKSLPT